ncbi:MAG: helix-turn-helix transcriptional regulator [Paenisporosarcina sp.]
MEIYQLIHQYREMSGMSQIDAAKELSIAPSTLSKYENNNAQISIKMFVNMCKIYGIPKEVFVNALFNPEEITSRNLPIAKEKSDTYDEFSTDHILELYYSHPIYFQYFHVFNELPADKQEPFIQMLKSFIALQR